MKKLTFENNPIAVRILPYAIYVGIMALSPTLQNLDLRLYVAGYGLQCIATAWVLWRWKKSYQTDCAPTFTVPQLAWGLITGVLIALMWLVLGLWITDIRQAPPSTDIHPLAALKKQHPALFPFAMALRLAGMTLIVPIMEELMFRSGLARGFSSWKKSASIFMQILAELPIIGDIILRKDAGKTDVSLTAQFNTNALGSIGKAGFIISSLAFAMGHAPRDWLAAFLCGIIWCLMLKRTPNQNRNLWPVIASHAAANLALWLWTLHTDSWAFL